jgi:astacin (peptidase family M12A)
MADTVLVCTPKYLPRNLRLRAARTAVEANPVNHAPLHHLSALMPGFKPTAEHIALVTTKYWGAGGVKMTVGFLDNPDVGLKKKILDHMNAWAKTANVQFTETQQAHDAQVRIARVGGKNGGYWSYIGTDVLHIPHAKQTMNLEGFTVGTADSEFHRVVRHETGHTLGFPHEHMRRQLVKLIDAKKAIAYFGQTQGWSPEMVRAQVLTPLEDSSLLGTPKADPHSIMCYQIPGVLTKSGKPIVGGTDIDASDFRFAAKVYPKPS